MLNMDLLAETTGKTIGINSLVNCGIWAILLPLHIFIWTSGRNNITMKLLKLMTCMKKRGDIPDESGNTFN